mmetsp:Transcript_7320/g.17271  ORF Transcript_7320/g.17271 Transcript_7320/m.17271 type:complete len:161 (+) Transcript_7320:1754-2236(+)
MGEKWWPHAQSKSTIRPMANCLLPVGVPTRAFSMGPPTGPEPQAQGDLMPGSAGHVIQVDGRAPSGRRVSEGRGGSSKPEVEHTIEITKEPWSEASGHEGTAHQIPCKWIPPDLSVGSDFYKARPTSLRKAAATLIQHACNSSGGNSLANTGRMFVLDPV